MRQRALTAMAVANGPALLIADEPTTALDVTVQDQILQLMRDLNGTSGTAILLITHNIAVVASLCQRLIVMYAGRVVEDGPTDEVLTAPRHPYTLVAAAVGAAPRPCRRSPGRDQGPATRSRRAARRLPLPSTLPVGGDALYGSRAVP